jgi:hypothetical protein
MVSSSAIDLFRVLNLPGVHDRVDQQQMQTIRGQLLSHYGTPSKHSASSSVSYTLLLGLSVKQFLAGAQAPVQAPARGPRVQN